MKRLPFVAICLVGVVFVVLLTSAGGSLRRLLYLTTADPSVLGLVASTSMEPIELTLHMRRVETVPRPEGGSPVETGNTIDAQITFAVPAAYVEQIDLREGPEGPQWLGFAIWSKTSDPYMPDHLKSAQMALPNPNGSSFPVDNPASPSNERRRAGEYDLTFGVSNYIRPREDDQQRVLNRTSLPNPDGPCERTELTDLNLERLAVPAGVKPGDSCLQWFSVKDVHYRQRNPDGSLRFAAVCQAGGKDRTGKLLEPPSCWVTGFFRNWPLRILVRGSKPESLQPAFDRVQAFLSSIVKADPAS